MQQSALQQVLASLEGLLSSSDWHAKEVQELQQCVASLKDRIRCEAPLTEEDIYRCWSCCCKLWNHSILAPLPQQTPAGSQPADAGQCPHMQAAICKESAAEILALLPSQHMTREENRLRYFGWQRPLWPLAPNQPCTACSLLNLKTKFAFVFETRVGNGVTVYAPGQACSRPCVHPFPGLLL